MNSNLFGAPLARDPSVALPVLRLQMPAVYGPVRMLQFVIEIVGPRTIPASSVQVLLQPHWQHALGHPEVFVMAGADANWRPLVLNDGSGAYDSLILAWDLVGPRGEMTVQVAENLWSAADDLAKQLGRRALAMPIPHDVPQNVLVLSQIRESLDIGFGLAVTATGRSIPEVEVWQVAAALGLQYEPNGTFVWKAEGSEAPLFAVTPGEGTERFLLSQVQAGMAHACIGLGFSVPLCPSPLAAVDGCLKAGEVFAQRLKGQLLDEDGWPLNDRTKLQARKNMEQAVGAFSRAGIVPGSVEAKRLFG